MIRKYFALAAISAPLLLAQPVAAQSLKLRTLFAEDRAKVASEAKEANDACGTQIAFSIDYTTFGAVLDDENNQNPWAYLANVSDALKSVCRSEEGKASVAAKIKSVVVSHGDAENESLANGVFRYTVPYSGHSPTTVVTWLQNNL